MSEFEQTLRNIKSKKFSPIYLLMGDEPFFIDLITQALIDNVVEDDFKDFNQSIFYGSDTTVNDVILGCRRFPMMSERQLIVIKEAQKLSKIEDLLVYVEKPLSSTVLVLAYKYGTIDKRKKLVGAIGKIGEIFESKKIPDYKLPEYLIQTVKSKDLQIDQKSAQILADHLGNDLSKLNNELDKLKIILAATAKNVITPELIETNIGVSKEFNNFELLKAVVQKDFPKALLIANYFESNSKNNPIILTITVLFNYFSNLMICYWAKDKSENGLAAELGFRSSFQARDYVQGCKNYNAWKTMAIVSLLRTYDAKSKGFGNSSVGSGELLKELLYKIIH